MCHIFKEFLRQFLEVYIDDLYVHSKRRGDHLQQLQKIFETYKLYKLSLNPEKCVFMVCQGKIMGHIVSKNGILTDEAKIIAIVVMPKPENPKQV